MLNPTALCPILQFGTSRFLQAHVDLFVSEALTRGEALGGIVVVQTTDSSTSGARVRAMAAGAAYPVRVRGLRDGAVIDETIICKGVRGALRAADEWPRLRDAVAGGVQAIVSNTGDSGYVLDERDTAALINTPGAVPHSFPAKLLVLLQGRWLTNAGAPLSIFPCELVTRNGDVLRDIVTGLAGDWRMPGPFVAWLRGHCLWVNSLVDRIVSQSIHPVGAVAEPYALWAVERQPGLVLPCRHEAIVLTDDLQRFERLKLHLLNLGHTALAERWLVDGRAADETVLDAMNDPALRRALEAVWSDEVMPVFEALGESRTAAAYLLQVRERFCNPFLAHRIADIAQNHAQKKARRFGPVIELAQRLAPTLPQAFLRQALARSA